MIPFFAFSMTSVFTGKYFRSLTVIVVITVAVLGIKEPSLVTIEMLIIQIHFQFLHLRLEDIELLAF